MYVDYFKSLQGILKISEWVTLIPVTCYNLIVCVQVLTLIIILVLRYGGNMVGHGHSGMFLSVGTSVGSCLIVSAAIIAHAIGDRVSLQELSSDALAALLLFVSGIVEISTYNKQLISAGILSLLTAAVFIVDLVMLVRNTKISLQNPI